MAKKHLILVAPVGDPADGAWSNKFEQTVIEVGEYQLEYWGWKRYAGQSDSISGAAVGNVCYEKESTTQAGTPRRLLHSGCGRGGWRAMAGYPIWMIKLFRAYLCMQGGLFVCATLDSALACAAASLCRKVHFVFANMDNMSKSFQWPCPVRWILERLENFTADHSCMHILPSPVRWKQVTVRERFLHNSPTSRTIQKAIGLAERNSYQRNAVFTIYFNGLLVPTRGCRTLLQAVKVLPRETIRVIIAGKCKCQEVEDLAKLPNVMDLGMLPMDEALALNYKAHLAFTFYDPAIELNRIAQPNKWEDCIATHTPFIVNDEVVTARCFMDKDACVHSPYHDWISLAGVLKHLAERREEWCKVQQNLSMFSTSAWDLGLLRLLDELPWNEVL